MSGRWRGQGSLLFEDDVLSVEPLCSLLSAAGAGSAQLSSQHPTALGPGGSASALAE